jgi:uncharacterized protein YggE
MRSTRVAVLAVILAPLALPAQATTDTTVSVSITRSARVLADRATILIGVEGVSESAREAAARAETSAGAVTEAIRKLAIPVTVERPVTVLTGDNPALRGLPVSQLPTSRLVRLVIRVSAVRPEQLSRLLSAAVEAGAKGAVSFAFESSAVDSVRRVLLADAAGAAKPEAEAVATSLGGHLGALLGATTSGSPMFPASGIISFDNAFGSSNQSPEVSIVVTLTVRYRLLR